MLLDPTNNRHMKTFGNKHVLLLKNVRETDFGNYSCMADNSLGRERGSIEVSGRPHAAKIVSPRLGSFKDQYNLTWTVNSFLPIEEYRILYRVNTVSFTVFCDVSAILFVIFARPTLSTMRTSLLRQQPNLDAFPSPTASSPSSGQILFHRLKIHTRLRSTLTDSHTLATLSFMDLMPRLSTRL